VLRAADRYRSQALGLLGCAVIAAGAAAGSVVAAKSSEVQPAGPAPRLLTPEG
jgi:hypothetical protein